MSDQPARLEKLLKDYAAAKTKLQGLQDVASSHALLLNRIVELLRTGGVKGPDLAQNVESYLSGALTQLQRDLLAACDERDNLKEKLAEHGVSVED